MMVLEAESISAAVPDTNGVAMEVPDKSAQRAKKVRCYEACFWFPPLATAPAGTLQAAGPPV